MHCSDNAETKMISGRRHRDRFGSARDGVALEIYVGESPTSARDSGIANSPASGSIF
jgi:hypothetical protein